MAVGIVGNAAIPERGQVALVLALRKLATIGTVMHVTAHPDDEPSGVLAMQSRGQGLRVVLATATRGNGGQNEIGPELYDPLAVLRTAELEAMHLGAGHVVDDGDGPLAITADPDRLRQVVWK